MIEGLHTRQYSGRIRSFFKIAILLLYSLFLISCIVPLNGSPLSSTPQTTHPQSTPKLTASHTQDTSKEGTTTPTPGKFVPQVVFVIPPGADLVLADQLQNVLNNLASQSGYLFETRSSLAVGDLNPNLSIVVAMPPDPGLADLVASAQATQFLGINISGLEPSTNLSIIGSQEASPALRGFLAGYLSAAVTYEWRVGVIGVSDTSEGVAAQQGFINGVIYFCGLCKQLYPPFNIYPLYVNLPSSSSPSEWQAAADLLVSKAVKTIYVVPGAGDEALLIHLADAGINIIGNNPPPNSIKDHWIATLDMSYIPAIENIWADLLNSKGGIQINTTFLLNHINDTLFSTGRQKMVMEFVGELMSGMIDTGVKP